MRKTSVERLIGRLITVGFSGTVLPDWLKEALQKGLVGGIILFKRNIRSLMQERELISEARRIAANKLIVAVDEEGGRITRHTSPFPHIFSPQRFGEIDDFEFTRAAFRTLGRALKRQGYNIDFAPVADVRGAVDTFIKDRAFGSQAEIVSKHVEAAIAGLKDANIACCAKHFPGHGSASGDSHVFLPHVDEDPQTLFARDIEPFRHAINAGVDAVMTAHLRVPALDPEEPATFSYRILNDLLRGELGFDGVIISDDLMMGAVKDVFLTPGEAAVAALNAGCDMLLYCGKKPPLNRVHAAIKEALKEHTLEVDALESSAERIESMLERHEENKTTN